MDLITFLREEWILCLIAIVSIVIAMLHQKQMSMENKRLQYEFTNPKKLSAEDADCLLEIRNFEEGKILLRKITISSSPEHPINAGKDHWYQSDPIPKNMIEVSYNWEEEAPGDKEWTDPIGVQFFINETGEFIFCRFRLDLNAKEVVFY